ncbi:MAG: ankyrin repeat domain-containing protein, partial [Rickettsiales bacterium]
MGKGKYAITVDQLRILNHEFKPKSVILKEQLITAVATNNLVQAKELLDQNVDVNLKFCDLKQVERTLLGYAVETQNLQMVELLLNKKANPNILYGAGEGSTALIRAVYLNNIDIVKILLNQKADPNIADNSGWTTVTYAVSENTEVLELLIEKNGSVNTTNNNNVLYLTPLMKAIKLLKDEDALKVMQILLEHRANVDATEANGDTLLNYAIKYHR